MKSLKPVRLAAGDPLPVACAAANAAAAQSAERMQAGGSRFRASKILMKTGAYT